MVQRPRAGTSAAQPRRQGREAVRWHLHRGVCVRFCAFALLALTWLLVGAAPAWSLLLTPEAALKHAEQSITHPEGVVWTLDVEVDEGDRISRRTLLLTAKGFNVLAEVLRPREMQGQLLLRSKAELWAINPGESLPAPLRPNDRYLGPVSYDNLMPTDYLDNYHIEAVAEDTAFGEACLLFTLRGNEELGEYDMVRLWVSKERLVAVKANFYGPTGRFLTSAHIKYEHDALIDGEIRPFISEMIIRSGLFSDASARLEWSPPQILNIPSDTFELRALLGPEAYAELLIQQERERQREE
ncbi:hypothetical protein DPQ33_10470 [Oceanidesulfovibrio indonesiensis]|uniref:Uncharacterized protein TP-0789 domain-containing protein n=1 Tax=Oceanidesulfovibrio indonesiensis TaxID=54767 RepID=A0A7M3MDR2_9BACT|nr:hypothetical protein DPQ33_10470 [Oceanidesulfovibrio indonesiensis]